MHYPAPEVDSPQPPDDGARPPGLPADAVGAPPGPHEAGPPALGDEPGAGAGRDARAGSEAGAGGDDGAPAPKRTVKSLVEWVVVIVGALVVALVIKTFLLQAFYIPSLSMEPTLHKGDRVLVNKLSYRLHDVNRGDIVVFERPEAEGPDEIKDLIKRVIALPGDTISQGPEGTVLINGRVLEEPYLPDGTVTEDLRTQTVPDGYVFVMGDNRGDSRDSRFFGPIREGSIVGRAFVRVWPLSHLGFL